VATETDAARDRVLAARAELGDELEALEASVRAAVDVPAKIRRSPAKAAGIVGGAAFLALGGPKRAFRAAKQAVTGEPAPMPHSMLPDEVEKTLRKLGDDGDQVRGALERDFAEYAKRAEKDRVVVPALLLTTVARPILSRAVKSATEWLFRTDDEGFQAHLGQVRDRTRRQAAEGGVEPGPASGTSDEEAGSAGA
jgi:hypothetical protein